MAFDPYHQWLGIPLQEQPPNYYRLLGVQLFEADRSVIDHAADRQMAHLRSFQQGPRGSMAEQLLNEVSAARVCLLDQTKKTAYDAVLNANRIAPSLTVAALSPDLPPLATVDPGLPPLAAGEPEMPPQAVESSSFQVSTSSHRPPSPRSLATPQPARPTSGLPQAARPPAARTQPARPRKQKNVALEIVKVVVGGAAGVLVALLIGGLGFGVGPFGSGTSQEEPKLGSNRLQKDDKAKNRVAAKPSSRAPAQSRVQARSQPATQRFSETPGSESETDSGANLDSAERRAAALARVVSQTFAEVVPLLGGEFLPLAADVPSTTSDRYVWSNVDPQLKGLHFLKNEHQQRTTDFKIAKPGGVLLAVHTEWRSGPSGEWQEDTAIQKDLMTDGWDAVGNLASHVSGSLGDIQKFVIFARDCQSGETFSYRAGKDIAPVLIWKPDSAMLAQGDGSGENKTKFGGPTGRSAKQPVPDEATIKVSRETVREIFKQEYAAIEDPQHTPEELNAVRLKFAKSLHVYADEVQDDFAARFVLLSEAFRQAVAAGNVQIAQQLTDRLTAEYEVDEFAWRQDLLAQLAQTVQTDREKLELAISAIALANQLLDTERLEEALGVAELAQSLGERNERLKARAQACGDEIRAAQQQWNAIQEAKATLAANPADAPANLLYGTFLCLKKNDWTSGLPLLAKGSDERLLSIAGEDIDEQAKEPSANEQIIALADKWYELAKSDASYSSYLARAYHWYAAALPEAKSLARIKLEKRLEELQEYDPARSLGQDAAGGASGQTGSIAGALKRLSRVGSSFAKIQLTGGGDFVQLEVDSDITSNTRSHRWSEIPQELLEEKLAFLRNKDQQHTLKFSITGSGIVLMAALWTDTAQGGNWENEASTRQGLETDGWVPAGKLKSLNRLVGETNDWVLFARYCKKGEAFSCRTHVNMAPVLILK